MRRSALASAAVVAILGFVAPPASAAAVPGTSCPLFPADSWWHADISGLPVHPASEAYVASMGASSHLHADFGSGTWDGGPIGIPYVVVDSSTPAANVTFDYDDESDHGTYRVPADPPIEGGPASTGDRHVLLVDRDACTLAELYAAYPVDGGWAAGSGAIWDLRSNALRPDGWTSADAAGLPILPGLVRRDEVAAGFIDHAIRVTARRTAPSHIWPARHDAGSDGSAPPMGLRLRLRAGVDISGFPRDDQVILTAMKTYGLVVADNGSSWYVSGVPDEGWDNDVLHALGQLSGTDFEAVDASSLMVDPSSGQVGGGSLVPAQPDTLPPTAPAASAPDTPPSAGPAGAAAAPTAAATAASATTDASTTTVAPDPIATTTTSLVTAGGQAAARGLTLGAASHSSRPWWPLAAAAGMIASVAGAAAVRLRRRSALRQQG